MILFISHLLYSSISSISRGDFVKNNIEKAASQGYIESGLDFIAGVGVEIATTALIGAGIAALGVSAPAWVVGAAIGLVSTGVYYAFKKTALTKKINDALKPEPINSTSLALNPGDQNKNKTTPITTQDYIPIENFSKTETFSNGSCSFHYITEHRDGIVFNTFCPKQKIESCFKKGTA